MKYFLISVIKMVVFSGKKNTKETALLPDTYATTTYYVYLQGNLNVGIGNNGPVDTTFTFSENLLESSKTDSYVVLKKITYNTLSSATVDNRSGFLSFANNSSGDVKSDYVGNFLYSNNTQAPLIGNADSLSLSTFSGNEIVFHRHNITNADKVIHNYLINMIE